MYLSVYPACRNKPLPNVLSGTTSGRKWTPVNPGECMCVCVCVISVSLESLAQNTDENVSVFWWWTCQGVLDYLDSLDISQIRKLYRMLCHLAFSPSNEDPVIQVCDLSTCIVGPCDPGVWLVYLYCWTLWSRCVTCLPVLFDPVIQVCGSSTCIVGPCDPGLWLVYLYCLTLWSKCVTCLPVLLDPVTRLPLSFSELL